MMTLMRGWARHWGEEWGNHGEEEHLSFVGEPRVFSILKRVYRYFGGFADSKESERGLLPSRGDRFITVYSSTVTVHS